MKQVEYVLHQFTRARIPLSRSEITIIARAVAREVGERRPIGFGLVIVGNQRMRILNRTHRGKDAITDVLSFPVDNVGVVEGVRQLGDIILAPAYIDRQVSMIGGARKQRYVILLIHGLLHLFGFDHEDDHDFAAMLKHEEALYHKLAHQLRIPSERII